MSATFRFTYGLTQCYLELARSTFTSIHSKGKKENHRQEIVNVKFALTTTTIICSYMAIEAFVNYQLYRIWEKRNSNTDEGRRFNTEFPKANTFKNLKNHRSIRELKERIKTLCRLSGYNQIHDQDKELWQDFTELVDEVRHFLIHPFPDPEKVNETMNKIMENKADLYVRVAEKIIKHLYSEAQMTSPEWLEKNKLLENTGYILLTDNQ